MQKHVSVLMAAAFVLVSGMAVNAQQDPGSPGENSQHQHRPAEQGRSGATGGEMMGGGMMGDMMGGRGRGGMHHGMMGSGGMMPPVMKVVFALIDSDGDGAISLQEFQAAHERIFKAMDADKDGKLELEEMQTFMRGMPAAPQQP